MGYILPVNSYQYQDYQTRTTQKERSPFALEKVFKAGLTSKLKQDQPKEQDRLGYQQINGIYTSAGFHAASPSTEAIKKEISEAVYSEMTGKGRNFSETV